MFLFSAKQLNKKLIKINLMKVKDKMNKDKIRLEGKIEAYRELRTQLQVNINEMIIAWNNLPDEQEQTGNQDHEL